MMRLFQVTGLSDFRVPYQPSNAAYFSQLLREHADVFSDLILTAPRFRNRPWNWYKSHFLTHELPAWEQLENVAHQHHYTTHELQQPKHYSDHSMADHLQHVLEIFEHHNNQMYHYGQTRLQQLQHIRRQYIIPSDVFQQPLLESRPRPRKQKVENIKRVQPVRKIKKDF